MQPTNILYTAHVHATGGREGRAASDDGALAVMLSTPKALGGPGGAGTNPEQLFGAGYAGCFLGALKYVAGQNKIALPASSRIDAEVGIGPIPTGFALRVKLRIQLPGINPERPAHAKLGWRGFGLECSGSEMEAKTATAQFSP